MNSNRILRRIKKAFRSLKYGNFKIWNKEIVEDILIKNNDIALKLGELNKDKTIYLIDLSEYKSGFFAQLYHTLGFLDVAKANGWAPVIRMNEEMYGGKENTFEAIFEQPGGISIKDALKSNKVVVSEESHLKYSRMKSGYDKDIDEQIEFLSQINREYIKYRENIFEKLQKDESDVIRKSKKTLGVHIRGGDYNQNWKGHPTAVSVDDYIQHIDEALSSGFENIFLATDDERIKNRLISLYSDKLKYYDDVTRTTTDVGVHYQQTGTRLAYEVVRDMHTLSVCDGLIAGGSLVPRYARIENAGNDNRYSYVEIINNGIN